MQGRFIIAEVFDNYLTKVPRYVEVDKHAYESTILCMLGAYVYVLCIVLYVRKSAG